MLQVENLSIYYGKILAVHGVSFTVDERELVAIIGANGAGKTSLINAIAGIKLAQEGSIALDGQEITRLSSWEQAGLGLVPEGGRVFPELSVKRNLLVGAYRRRDRAGIAASLDEVFALFPVLRERRHQLAGTLSGGERQMLAIGRALMGEPQLLLVDEISMGLMPKLVTEVFSTLARLRDEQGTSILLAEQNAKEALDIVDRGYVLENGRIALQGSAAELKQDERVKRAYLGI